MTETFVFNWYRMAEFVALKIKDRTGRDTDLEELVSYPGLFTLGSVWALNSLKGKKLCEEVSRLPCIREHEEWKAIYLKELLEFTREELCQNYDQHYVHVYSAEVVKEKKEKALKWFESLLEMNGLILKSN